MNIAYSAMNTKGGVEMGLINFDTITKREKSIQTKEDSLSSYKPIDGSMVESVCVGKANEILSKHIGVIEKGKIYNFWTFGRYAMMDVLKYVLSFTGPADVTACTWAITTEAVKDIINLSEKGVIKTFKIWIDPRVKVRNPEPLSMLQLNYPIAIAPVHAKVTVVSNEDWKVSISGSLNFTSNPQPERGVIMTLDDVWEADSKILNEAKYERFDG